MMRETTRSLHWAPHFAPHDARVPRLPARVKSPEAGFREKQNVPRRESLSWAETIYLGHEDSWVLLADLWSGGRGLWSGSQDAALFPAGQSTVALKRD